MRSLVQRSDPLTGFTMTGTGHTQVFLSLSLLRLRLVSFSETSVTMDAGVDYYSISYLQGNLLPHPFLIHHCSRDAVCCKKAGGYSWSSQGRDQIWREQFSLNQKMSLYTCQQEDYLTVLLSDIFKIINLFCNTRGMSWFFSCNCYKVLFITKGS